MASQEKYTAALSGKKLPIVTLDHKWHQLFSRVEKTEYIAEKEKELNILLKRQGKVNTETKDIRRLKKKLMEEIVELMENNDAASVKKIEENKRLINECNEKIESYQEESIDLPKRIQEINHELMVETMEACYNILRFNEEQIETIAEWIAEVRVELKKNVVRKQEMEIANQDIYNFMHNILGADVIEIFDMKYNPSNRPIHK